MKIVRACLLWPYRLVVSSVLVTGLWKAFLSNWRETIWWAVSNLVGGLMPLWTAIFLRRLYFEPFRLADFAAHGDFALYSAAFLAPAIYQAAASARKRKSLLRSGTVTLSSIALVFSAIVFTAVNPELTTHTLGAPMGAQENLPPKADLLFLFHTSLWLMLFSFCVALCVFLNDAYREFPDPDPAEVVDHMVLAGAVALQSPETAPGLQVPEQFRDGTPIESEEDLARKFTSDVVEEEDK